VNWFYERLKTFREKEAVIYAGKVFTYNDLLEEVEKLNHFYIEEGIERREVVAILSDYSPKSIALFLKLMENGNIIVPITTKNTEEIDMRIQEGYADRIISIKNEVIEVKKIDSVKKHKHQLIYRLFENNNAGLILFSSGSTGKPKAMLLDLTKIANNYVESRALYRTIVFLMFDHIGGVNTLFHILSSGGCMVLTKERTPEEVAKLIQTYQVELLPTSPTFLNLMHLYEVFKRYDFSSLKQITYGTESMPESLLKKLTLELPGIKLKQTYGLSEMGIMSTKSKSNDSLFMKIGGKSFQYKVIEGELFIKSDLAMLGYLNAPDPFTNDGWYATGDLVEEDKDGYIKIIGRKKEFINVGGQKVLPTEVEGVISEVEGVKDVVVKGEKNPIMGEVVVAYVSTLDNVDRKTIKKRIIDLCENRLEDYKVHVKITFVENDMFGDRFKKNRFLI